MITLITFWVVLTGAFVFSKLKRGRGGVGTIEGQYFGGRKLGFLAVGFGLLFTNINTVSFIGENELSFLDNMSVMAWGVSSVLAMYIVSIWVMPFYLKSGIATTPDFLEARYDASVKRVVSILFLAGYVLNLLPAVLYGSAVAFDGLFDLSALLGVNSWVVVWILVWLAGTLGTVYALSGGLKAIALSDVLLGFCMFAGGLFLPYFALNHLGGGDWQLGLHMILSDKLSHLNSIGAPGDAVPFSTIFTGMLFVNLYYWGTEQYIVQQVLGSKNLVTCQKGIALASLGKLALPLLLNIPGVIAAHLYTSLPNTSTVFTKLIGDVCPPVYVGFFAALLFGTTLTTFIACLNGASTLFVLNIYQPLMARRSVAQTDREMLSAARRFQVIIAVVAMGIAPFIIFATDGFYNYLQKIAGLFSVPIFTVMLVGFFTKRVPPIAAKVGLAFFTLSYGCTQLLFSTGLHFLHVLAILFVMTTILMLVIGRIWPMRHPYQMVQKNVVEIAPWKYRHLVGILLIAGAVLLFALFSGAGLAGV